MKIAKQARREAKQLFRCCLVQGVLAEDRVRRVVQALLTQKPRKYLAIATHFKRLVQLDQERQTARVQSAVPLSTDQQTALKELLTRRYGAGLHWDFQNNPALIGGVRVQVGSDVYDGSVRARLDALLESF